MKNAGLFTQSCIFAIFYTIIQRKYLVNEF